MASMTFAQGLSAALAAKSNPSRLQRRIRKIVDGPDSALRTWFLQKLEAHARVHLGVGQTQAIDWGSIDWDKVLDFLLKIASIIVALAPLFAGKKPKAKSTPRVSKSLGRTRTRKRR